MLKSAWICFFAASAVFAASVPEESCLKKVEQALRLDEYQTALGMLSRCGESPEAVRLRGNTHYLMYNADSAVLYLGRTAANPAADETSLLRYAEALLWKKDFQGAAKILARVPTTTGSPYLKVEALRLEMLGKFPQAVTIYDRLIRTEKQPWASQLRKGQVLSWMKKFDEAMALFSQVLAADQAPRSLRMTCVIRRAEVRAWNRQPKLALQELDSLVATVGKPVSPGPVRDRMLEALQLKGQVLEWEGRFPEAKGAYRDILLVDPVNRRAQLRLEKLLWVK